GAHRPVRRRSGQGGQGPRRRAVLREGGRAALAGPVRALSRRQDAPGRPRPEHAGRHPQGRPVGPGGRPRQARPQPALRESRDRPPPRSPAPRGAPGTGPRPAGRAPAPPPAPAPPEPAVSQHAALPILLRRCAACHGPRRQEAGLDVRSRASLLRGGKTGPAIVPGKADDSLLIRRARAGQMPPPTRLVEASVKPIEPDEIDVLARWVAAGAPEAAFEPDVATTTPAPLVSDKDRDFWAFRPPRPVAVPAVRHAGRVRNPIDAFVLHRLEQKGLVLSP